MSILGLLFVAGLFLDGWAHTHGKVDDSFFTPWHGVLYSGYALNFGALLAVAGLNWNRGYRGLRVLPPGYPLALFGMALWLLGGPGDLVWHTLFGIEENINALYSPTHLLLATGLVLASSGPWRAAWASAPKGLEQLPMLISLASTIAAVGFFIQFAHPVVEHWGFGDRFVPDVYHALGVSGFMLTTVLLMGLLLLSLRRWQLMPGAFSLVLGLSAVAMGFLSDKYPTIQLLGFVLTGVAMDLLYQWLKPGITRVGAARGFGFLAPVVMMGLYFALGRLEGPFNWSVHLVGGMIFLAGIVGLFMSLLVFPPALPDPAE